MIYFNWIVENPGFVTAIVGGVLSVASGVCEALGWTRASKVLGTVTVDAGRIMRYGKCLIEARAALRG